MYVGWASFRVIWQIREGSYPMRPIRLSAALFLLLSIFWLTASQAASIYVDKDNPCPGSGTSSSPYCSIQMAFNAVAAGDQILIRDAASAYNENAILRTSGTASSPITIRPDSGHNPNITLVSPRALTGAIELKNVSHVNIAGLRFDGAGMQTSRYALSLSYTSGPAMTGIVIDGIQCLNWGGTGTVPIQTGCVRMRSDLPTTTRINATVRNSIFRGNRFTSIYVIGGQDVLLENNTITDTKCGLRNTGGAHAAGIKIGGESVGTIVRNNRINSHETYSDCAKEVTVTYTDNIWAGVYCDTGATDGLIEGNEIHSINYPNGLPSGDSVGIFLESRCSRWTTKKNLVYKVWHKGVRNGSASTGDPDNNTYINNTFSSIHLLGIWIRRGANQTIKNNIVQVDSSGVPIEFNATAAMQAGHQVDYNLYWDMQSGTKVGRWGSSTTHDLMNWRRQCDCDARALSNNPLFVSLSPGSENFHLSPSSPARGAGQGGVDLGAFISSGVLNAPNKLSVVP
jgi:parallel beta-helix repeat protein